MKDEITIKELKPLPVGLFEVNVSEADGDETVHKVQVEEEYVKKLGWGVDEVSDLLHFSFEFLLEREPKESILPEFNLLDITRYFPEFEEEMRK